MEKVQLMIAGECFNISTDNDAEYAVSLGNELDMNIREILDSSSRVSITQAAVLTALDYLDKYRKSEQNCEILRNQVQEYLDDAARARADAEVSKREIERLNKEIESLK